MDGMWAWPFGVGVAFQRCARFSRGRAYGKGQLVKERVMGVPSPGWGGGVPAYARPLVGLLWGWGQPVPGA